MMPTLGNHRFPGEEEEWNVERVVCLFCFLPLAIETLNSTVLDSSYISSPKQNQLSEIAESKAKQRGLNPAAS
jgi:hypothetical protein